MGNAIQAARRASATSAKRPGTITDPRGAALFSVLLALAGAMLVGAGLLFQAVLGQWKDTESRQQVNDIAAAARAFGNDFHSYAGISVARLDARALLPDGSDRLPDGHRLALWNADDIAFIIGIENLDEDSCSKILSPFAGRARNRGGGGLLQAATEDYEQKSIAKPKTSGGKITVGGGPKKGFAGIGPQRRIHEIAAPFDSDDIANGCKTQNPLNESVNLHIVLE